MGNSKICNNFMQDNCIRLFIDSGCTDHLVNDKKYFCSLKKLENPINIAVAKNDHYLQAEGIGNIYVVSYVNDKQVKYNIQNVLYVPSLRKNLLSVKRLGMCNIKVVFENDEVKLFYNDNMIGIGYRNNLYEIAFEIVKGECLDASIETSNTKKLWHERFGHIG